MGRTDGNALGSRAASVIEPMKWGRLAACVVAAMGVAACADPGPAEPAASATGLAGTAAQAAEPVQSETGGFTPVTDETLRNPDPADWLMYSRTYDAQRYSPLDQINRSNVASLEQAWHKPLTDGTVEVIPIVYQGVMYITTPGGGGNASSVMALDATTGDVIWEYQSGEGLTTRLKALAIYDDMIFYTAPGRRNEPAPVIALDARTGEVRWETPVTAETHTAGAIVADGKVISGRTCNSARENCYIVAHDAKTGEEVWRFYTAPDAGEPGDESWGGTPPSERRASTWGLPGTYDAERGLVYWGISNPMPNTRADRHGGDVEAIPPHAPADLYSNSTVALDVETGELVWYYQHLPGDDWDMDINHEKMIVNTVVDPDPEHVKWINPRAKGTERDVIVTVGEGGGIWLNDAGTGEFLWATPFPHDTPHFILSDIDVETGVAHINWDLVLTEPGAQRLICYWNTRSYWPTAYHPGLNSLYVPYTEMCLNMTRAVPGGAGERRTGQLRPGVDPENFAGLVRIDLQTGEMHTLFESPFGTNGAVLATGGDLVFFGDITQQLRAFDAESGEVLWESDLLGAGIQNSTITYAVDGKQYVAVLTGEQLTGIGYMTRVTQIEPPPRTGNSIYVFALP